MYIEIPDIYCYLTILMRGSFNQKGILKMLHSQF